MSNTDFGQEYFFQDGNLTSQRLNTKHPFDSLYITHGQLDDTKVTKVSNLSNLRMSDDEYALVNIFTTSLVVLKTINFPHNNHPEAHKRWAVLRLYKDAHFNSQLNVKADPKQKKKKGYSNGEVSQDQKG